MKFITFIQSKSTVYGLEIFTCVFVKANLIVIFSQFNILNCNIQMSKKNLNKSAVLLPSLCNVNVKFFVSKTSNEITALQYKQNIISLN